MKNPTKLTIKQRAFVNALLELNDQTAAAIKAGVPVKSADKVGSQWMKHPKFRHVQEEFRRLSELATERSVLTAAKTRDMVNGLLDLNPLDWFTPVGKPGVWSMPLEEYKKLPWEVARYITGMSSRKIVTDSDEEEIITFTLMCKDNALNQAVKLTEAGQEKKEQGATVDWDALSKRRPAGEHPVAAKIKQAGVKAIADKPKGDE